jgi:hypothetical protein
MVLKDIQQQNQVIHQRMCAHDGMVADPHSAYAGPDVQEYLDPDSELRPVFDKKM